MRGPTMKAIALLLGALTVAAVLFAVGAFVGTGGKTQDSPDSLYIGFGFLSLALATVFGAGAWFAWKRRS